MSMTMNIKDIATVAGTVRHTVALSVMLVTGVVSVTLLYAQVGATQEKADANTQKLKIITDQFHKLAIQQRVILQQIEGEKEDSKEFRKSVDKSLDRILDKLDANNRRIQ